MLDLIEKAFRRNSVSFRRIDGQTTLAARINALTVFREDPDCKVLLATIGSVGEG